jgi:hypothetical protein
MIEIIVSSQALSGLRTSRSAQSDEPTRRSAVPQITPTMAATVYAPFSTVWGLWEAR